MASGPAEGLPYGAEESTSELYSANSDTSEAVFILFSPSSGCGDCWGESHARSSFPRISKLEFRLRICISRSGRNQRATNMCRPRRTRDQSMGLEIMNQIPISVARFTTIQQRGLRGDSADHVDSGIGYPAYNFPVPLTIVQDWSHFRESYS